MKIYQWSFSNFTVFYCKQNQYRLQQQSVFADTP